MIFGPGHTLSGAKRGFWIGEQLGPTVEFFVPVVLLLLTVRARHGPAAPTPARGARGTGCMVAAASFVLLYYQKVLARADQIHVAEVFIVTLPLLLLWLMTGAEALDDGARKAAGRLLAGGRGRRRRAWARLRARGRRGAPPRHPGASSSPSWPWHPTPVGTVKAVAVGLPPARAERTGPGPPGLRRIPASSTRPWSTTSARSSTATPGQTGPVFDFNDEPGLLYYLLEPRPGHPLLQREHGRHGLRPAPADLGPDP